MYRYRFSFLVLLITFSVSLMAAKTFSDRCLHFAKGLGLTTVGIGSTIWSCYCIYDSMPIKKHSVDQEDVEKKCPDQEIFIQVPNKPRELTTKSLLRLGLSSGVGAAVLFTNYKYLIPRAYAHFKQALSAD